MALENVAAFAASSACGASDPKKEEKPASACGSACGTSDPKKEAPASACGTADPKKQAQNVPDSSYTGGRGQFDFIIGMMFTYNCKQEKPL